MRTRRRSVLCHTNGSIPMERRFLRPRSEVLGTAPGLAVDFPVILPPGSATAPPVQEPG